LLTTTSNDADGNGRSRASASTRSTRSRTPYDSVVLDGGATIATLITAPPNIRSHRLAFRQPMRCK
jgi:hypothetical protein